MKIRHDSYYEMTGRNLGSLEAQQGNSGYAGPKLGHRAQDVGDSHAKYFDYLLVKESRSAADQARLRAGEVSDAEWQAWTTEYLNYEGL